MFESLGPAVPGSPVMEDRKADLLPYLSQEAQRSRISFPGGQPELGGVLGCRRCWGALGLGQWTLSGAGGIPRQRCSRAYPASSHSFIPSLIYSFNMHLDDHCVLGTTAGATDTVVSRPQLL